MLGMPGEIGVIAPGSYADIIAVPANPLADIDQMGKVYFVMKDGKVYLDARVRVVTGNQ
jgi:imidazolonepropionase-like amidohydrolase